MSTDDDSTVFVLDDDPAIRDSLAELFQATGLPARFYATVSDFLDDYEPSWSGCLLLDIRLPGNGFEVLNCLADDRSHLPVIVISGHGNREARDRARSLGAVAFFEKPFDGLELCEQIRKVLEPAD